MKANYSLMVIDEKLIRREKVINTHKNISMTYYSCECSAPSTSTHSNGEKKIHLTIDHVYSNLLISN